MLFKTGRPLLILAAGVVLAGCSGGDTAAAPLSLVVDPSPLPDATVGQPYSHVTSVTGGTPPYSLTISEGNLPSGVTLSSAGSWTGTPVAQGTYPMTVTATDSSTPPLTGSQVVDLFVWSSGGPLTFSTSSLPAGELNAAYSGRVLVTGGTVPYLHRITDGALPPGLSLDTATGYIVGVPTATGVFPVTFEVEDSTLGGTPVTSSLSIPIVSSFVSPGSHSPSLDVSRTSGVAPLSVFFDATNYAVSGVGRPFHELYFHWEFGDPLSRQRFATGGVAAHVFEMPGSYSVRLTVQAPDGSTHCQEQTIIVQDTSSVFAGTNTICFSNNGSFTGAPAGALQVTTGSFDAALGYLANGKRLLFQRGHIFTATNPPAVSTTANASIGAFGAGQNPDARGIYANNPRIESTVPEAALKVEAHDLRIMDLHFVDVSSGTAHSAIGPATARAQDVLVLRVATDGFENCIGFSHDLMQYYHSAPYEAITIADCRLSLPNAYSIYAGGRRLAFLGSWFDRCSTSHLIRITFANQCVIDGNLIEYPGGTRHAIKLHAQQDRALYGDYTEKVVIRGNKIRATTPWPIAIGTQDTISDEWVRDVVLEKNILFAENGVQAGFYIVSQDTTLRNNVFVGQNNNAYDLTAILVEKRGISPTPSGIEIYNNTYYNATAGNTEESLLVVNQHTGLIRLENNIVHAPTSTARLVYPGGASLVAAQANLVNQAFAFVNPAALNFTPGPTSAALGIAVQTPARDDYLGKPRLFDDIGAFGR